ncbi:Eco47II family restriction endonuclease [Campylobacter jejuni]|nr:Eco47II family restriction endonuclease [Campylobacter jejuni]ECR1616324.1 Eco47II family restriction endonuclease [Campylobacter jejuni]
MQDNYFLEFINQRDFENHILNTVKGYQEVLKKIDLKKFNENIIDPIKLTFDKTVFDYSFEKLIELELHRQRDKTNTNIIGYFHQNIFKYIQKCEVPKEGWDIIFKDGMITYFIEMKNKHNTMNSSSASKTFIRMQNQLLKDKECICALVEIIAKKSDNKPWVVSVDKKKQAECERLRRISIDKFYELVAKDKFAFQKLCLQIPITLNKVLKEYPNCKAEKDSVFEELEELDNDIQLALYKLAFKTYNGFDKI